MGEDVFITRGQLVWCNLQGSVGSEQKGNCPCIVIQNNTGNIFSRTYIVVPLTTRIPRKLLPTHLFVPGNVLGGRFLDSIVLCEQVRVVDEERIIQVGKKLPEYLMEKLDRKIEKSVGIGEGPQKNNRAITRGQIIWCDLKGAVGSEQKGSRPCVVIQNNKGNLHSRTYIVVPLTTRIPSKKLPTHLHIPKETLGTKFLDSMLLFEQMRVVDRERVLSLGKTLPTTYVQAIDRHIHTALGMKEAVVASV